MSELSLEQQEKIKADFTKWSGGDHPGDVDEKTMEVYVDLYGTDYGGEDVLYNFLVEWGEERTEQEIERARQQQKIDSSLKEEELKKSAQKLASTFVSLEGNTVILSVDDPAEPGKTLIFKLQSRESLEEAKAEAADLMWAVQTVLQIGSNLP